MEIAPLNLDQDGHGQHFGAYRGSWRSISEVKCPSPGTLGAGSLAIGDYAGITVTVYKIGQLA
jgi:hypothetical protein